MARVTRSKAFGLPVLMMLSMLVLFVHGYEGHGGVEAKDGSPQGEGHVKVGRLSFGEEVDSDHPTHCTCTCYPGVAPRTPKSPKPPTSQNSPTGRKRSPPPAPYYSPSPVYSSPAPPPGNTQSPVTFDSPPPPAPYSHTPAEELSSPVVSAPETFQPPPPIY